MVKHSERAKSKTLFDTKQFNVVQWPHQTEHVFHFLKEKRPKNKQEMKTKAVKSKQRIREEAQLLLKFIFSRVTDCSEFGTKQ